MKELLDKIKEEAAELIVAVCHYQAHKATVEGVISEMSDVHILTNKIILLLGKEIEYQQMIDYKVDRQNKRERYRNESL